LTKLELVWLYCLGALVLISVVKGVLCQYCSQGPSKETPCKLRRLSPQRPHWSRCVW